MKTFVVTCFLAAGLMSAQASAAVPSDANGAAYQSILKGQWSEAEALLRQGLAQNPDDATRLLNLAFVLQNTGRPTEAAKVYEHVLQLDRNPVVAVADPETMTKPARAKRLAKSGMAALENAKR
jgi:Flp pilus assembly protein TadD